MLCLLAQVHSPFQMPTDMHKCMAKVVLQLGMAGHWQRWFAFALPAQFGLPAVHHIPAAR